MLLTSRKIIYYIGITLLLCACATAGTGESSMSKQAFAPIDRSNQDPDFHIYLCFGQSNMEGAGKIQHKDLTVDERFKAMYTSKYPVRNKSKGNWYPAVPPLCYSSAGLSPADYFGRTMVENLPDTITVGVINVAVSGCDIRLFDKDRYLDFNATYKEDWFKNRVDAYNGNPYRYLIELGRKAQEDGVIKGILLHQGETNSGDPKWPSYVKKIYNDMLSDLELDAESVPLLVGELYSGPDSVYKAMNTIINRLPETIPTAYPVSSNGCEVTDGTHFSSEGYRQFGRHYAEQMLQLLNNSQ